MTIVEMMDYVKDVSLDGFTLTECGINAARTILEGRAHFSPSHKLMLDRINGGINPLPFKLARVVNRTRLGDALDLAREVNRSHIRNLKQKARRRARAARGE